jgi:energy-coupling factor transporter ATP-binding protein EcfA2
VPSALRIEDLTYRYPDGVSGSPRLRPALSGIDLEVAEGELVLLAGTSGSGKSTLLRAASGLVPHFFGGELAGRVVVGDLDTREHGPAEIARVASSLFQDPESQVVMSSVAAELGLPLETRGASGPEVPRAVEETALAVGVGDLLERPVQTLSGGELQRVALGAALVTQPRLLLLDEPTSQLDPVGGDELFSQLRRLNEEWGTSVILAEQRIERCLAAADRVVVLGEGSIACDAPPREFVAWAHEHAPELAPPAARMFALAGLRPLPTGVKDARRLLREGGHGPGAEAEPVSEREPRGLRRRFFRRRREATEPALGLDRVWVEFDDGTQAGLAALRGVDLNLAAGETVALLGRNGAGKSTLLRVAAGLVEPARGRVAAAGEVALVLQNPSDYLLHERVRDELPAPLARPVLEELGLEPLAEQDGRDLSGGERQRLALGIVLAGRGIGGGAPPAVVALDEPTRGMDRLQKERLATTLRRLAGAGAAVIAATHDVEFAAVLADRCLLLGRGRLMADGSTREVLSGGRYFATEVARVLGPSARAVLPADGAAWIAERAAAGADGRPAPAEKAVVR